MNLAHLVNSALRTAIRRNLVSFPSQIPAFAKDAEEQRRIVQLYFLHGWEIGTICERYGLGKWAVRAMLTDWKIRAAGAGYIQDIHPEHLDLLAREADTAQAEVFDQGAGNSKTLRSNSAMETIPALLLPVSFPKSGVSPEVR